MVNFRLKLSSQEADALAKLAYSEMRDPGDQIRWLLRRELERLEYLQPMPNSPKTGKGKASEISNNDG